MAMKKANLYLVNQNRESGSGWISISNALIRAGHGLTLGEKRLVAIALVKMDSKKPIFQNEIVATRITAIEYAEIFNIDERTAYDQLQSAARTLLRRLITFYKPAHKRGKIPLKPTIVQMHWIGRADYIQGEGAVELSWWPEILPHLTGLKRQFTTYQLKQTSALRSIHSWRLLELLMRFQQTGWAEYTIEDFEASMDATELQRANFGKLRTQVIEPAVKELTQKDNWIIRWEVVKAGRRVKAIRFTFERDPQMKLF
jgi:plasmid replication initiation protein